MRRPGGDDTTNLGKIVTQKKSTPLLKSGRKPGPKIACICSVCGDPFEVIPARVRQNGVTPYYCNRTCRSVYLRSRAYDRTEINTRFWAKILCGLTPDACWEWLGATYGFGYGHFAYGPRAEPTHTAAHIYSYVLHGGVLTTEKPCVLHACDRPPCANPRHLWAGTQQDNTQDMMSKGRGRYIVRHGSAHAEAKLTDEQVAIIRAEYVPYKTPLRIFAARFGVTEATIHLVARGKSYRP